MARSKVFDDDPFRFYDRFLADPGALPGSLCQHIELA
jgi:hypothetical protein